MLTADRGLGAQYTIGTPKFEPESAPVGVRTGHLLPPRRQVGPDALPTGLQLRSNLIPEPILKNGSNPGASARVRLNNGAPRRGAKSRRQHSG